MTVPNLNGRTLSFLFHRWEGQIKKMWLENTDESDSTPHTHTHARTHAYIWVAFWLVYFKYIIELFNTQYATKQYVLNNLNMQF